MSDSGDERSEGSSGRIGFWLGIAIGALILVVPGPAGLPAAAQRLAAMVSLMAIWWATQALPIAATSLVPLVGMPLLGIDSAKNVAATYLTDSSLLYFGGFVLALAIERWGLHHRLALHVVRITGTGARGIVWGFMLASFLVSMWISNTATTLMMLPIAMALITSLEAILSPAAVSETAGPEASSAGLDQLACRTYLGVAYAASIGGVATLVGTPTNIAFVSIWQKQFPAAPPVSASQWIMTWFPFGIVYLAAAWMILTVGLKAPHGLAALDRAYFRERLKNLGPVSKAEFRVFLIFIAAALLWLTRTDLQFTSTFSIPGWGQLATRYLSWIQGTGFDPLPAVKDRLKEAINDSTVALAMSLLLFIIPSGTKEDGAPARLMDWKTTNRLPWGILLLFGGGFAIAEGFRGTGLSDWSGHLFSTAFTGQPAWIVVGGICAMMIFLTEFTSNVATVNAVLPVFAGTSLALGLDPRLIMIPATIATSCGFMLPAGTPPNAIAFATGKIPIRTMMGLGLLINLTGVVLCTLATFFLLVPQQQIRFDQLPAWATEPTGK